MDIGEAPICREFGIEKGGYVFVAHGLMPGKRTEEVAEAVSILREAGSRLVLAIAGRVRFMPDIVDQGIKAGWIRLLGSLPNDMVRGLIAEAAVHVNVCSVEGMPRSSLEAIAAGALTVLPPGVPEFQEFCPAWIGTAGNPRILARDIGTGIEAGTKAPYPLERHDPQAVAKQYAGLLTG